MSQTIKVRTADQCRGHHRKMISQHRTISNIIKNINGKIKQKTNSWKKKDDLDDDEYTGYKIIETKLG